MRGVAIQIAEDLVGYPVMTVPNVEARYDVKYNTANTGSSRLSRSSTRSDDAMGPRCSAADEGIGHQPRDVRRTDTNVEYAHYQ